MIAPATRPTISTTSSPFKRAARGIRRAGAAALDLAYVAAGRLDGFWELKLKPWDVAAGVLLVREAGGTVTTFDGTDYDIFNGCIVASNGLIHEEMIAMLTTTRPRRHRMNRKRTALLLNALVLPGLGQLYLGRKATGIAIIMLVNLLLLLALFVLLKGLAPVIAAQAVSGAVSTQEIHAALQGVSGFGKALLGGFALLWARLAHRCHKSPRRR